MRNNFFLLAIAGLLSACGVSNRQIMPPELGENATTTWHYSCKDAYGLNVEYANMGGDYTATIYNEELPKRVLQKTSVTHFGDSQWQWLLDGDNTYTLMHDNTVVTNDCRSYSVVDNSGIVLLR